MVMDFLKDFEKQIEKLEGVTSSSEPPRYWHSFGNYVMNKVMAGSCRRGIGQGRVTGLAGPSGSGKSFVLGNLVREAQKDGAYILVIDSENAFDDEFAEAIGINTDDSCYNYKSVTTVPQVTKIVSSFLRGYKRTEGTGQDAQKILIAIDSLDMLMTETEKGHYDKGDSKGDQGQRNKQLKAMLRTFVQDIKFLNVAMVVTSQVYANQDLKNGEGKWVVSEAVKYSLSQISLLTKLKLKDKVNVRLYTGITMRCMGYKTRFTKPFQMAEMEVPYDTGMDPYSGIVEVGVQLGILLKKGSRYVFPDEDTSWFRKDMTEEQGERIVDLIDGLGKEAVVHIETEDEDDEQITETAKARRQRKALTEEE